ncbi:unnamed protein product [Prunus armeniaca]|uniref:Uncharacterized protein LOC103335701 isoform X1 n=1 Tax=Prunus mume TaxID=102107 RepID=A0ABM0PB16_PRUMU|nr:PREDICTED: uncharacterized protein LOC103335701 isoform X1 [Prunus mume]
MEGDNMRAFDMGTLRTSLPQNRRSGLSRYYSGKSRSFTCMDDVRSVEDLKKPEHPDAKKRKKHSERKNFPVPTYPPYPCRRVSSTTQCAAPCVGV